MTSEKHFPKTVSQLEFSFGLFTNLPIIIVARDFLRVYSNSKQVYYLPLQNSYPNLKSTCHIKLKFFLWAKLLENFLVTKYLMSVLVSFILLKLFQSCFANAETTSVNMRLLNFHFQSNINVDVFAGLSFSLRSVENYWPASNVWNLLKVLLAHAVLIHYSMPEHPSKSDCQTIIIFFSTYHWKAVRPSVAD